MTHQSQIAGCSVDQQNASSTKPDYAPGPNGIYRRIRQASDAIRNIAVSAFNVGAIRRNGRRRQGCGRTAAAPQLLEVRCLPSTLPVLTLSNTSVVEGDSGNTTATVTVTLSEPSASNVRVNYYTKNGTAVAARDFVFQSGTATIPAGETSASVNIKVIGDTTYEASESFDLVFTRPVNATLAQSLANVAVSNDDQVPSISISDATVIEAGTALVTLNLTHPSSTPITVHLTGVSDTAVSGIDFTALDRIFTIPAGKVSCPVYVPTRHDTLDEPLESFNVQITSVVGATVSDDSAVVSIQDNDPPALTISDVTISESSPPSVTSGDSPSATYEAVISMSSASTLPVTVRVLSRDKTAKGGSDFIRVAQTVIIPAGATSATVTLSSIDDQIYDPRESFELYLSSPINASLARPVALVSVTDDDPDPVLTVADTFITEGNTGELLATVRINSNRVSALPITFQYQTVNGTATAGSDYLGVAGTMTIPAGATFKTFVVRIKGDAIDEDAESIRVVLSSVVNGSVATQQGEITITDNDAPPQIIVSNGIITEGDAANVTSNFVVNLSSVSERNVSVDFHSADNTAIAGRDYQSVSGTLTIPAGQKSGTISLTSVADTIDEPSRAFRLVLSNATNAVLTPSIAVVTVADDDGTVLPLFQQSDMAYLGSFKVPAGQQGTTSFSFGGNGLAFNAANNSLFIGSHIDSGLNVAEIEIPTQLSSNGAFATMPTSTVLQSFTNLGGLLTTNASGQATSPILNYENLSLGGLLVANGGLTGGMFMGYTGAEPAQSSNSHFRTSSLNLASLNSESFAGLLDVRSNPNSVSGRVRGGYMAEVPEQWRDYIGASYVTGAAGQNRIEFSSAGPALFGFDATNPAGSSGDPLVYYPISKALQWSSQYVAQPLFNGTTKIEGVAFVPGTRSVIFIGSNGLSEIGYGVGSSFYDKARPYSGFHSRNGNYQYQIWSYDIDDFMAVRNGSMASWQIKPTSVTNFDLPTPEPSKFLGGTAFDPATGRLYVAQKLAGPDSTPVIHVYQLGRQAST